MLFKVITGSIPGGTRSQAFLYEDNWDDWFAFATRFNLWFVDQNGGEHFIGGLKIGRTKMGEGHRGDIPDGPNRRRRPGIPKEFDALPNAFFSLGQDDSYYQALAKLGGYRDTILGALRDIAYDLDLFGKVADEPVTGVSLLRSVTRSTVQRQYNRLAHGGVRLTPYDFTYVAPKPKNKSVRPVALTFSVVPESQPPTNVHVLIGRNGVGKTRLLHFMTRSLVEESADTSEVGRFATGTEPIDFDYYFAQIDEELDDDDSFQDDEASYDEEEAEVADVEEEDEDDNDEASDANLFANIVSVSFSAFDEFEPFPVRQNRLTGVLYDYIGLKYRTKDKEGKTRPPKSPTSLSRDFSKSVKICAHDERVHRWRRALEMLEADPIFKDAEVAELAELAKNSDEETLKKRAKWIFKKLSSGHKIVLLTITRLVETVEERTLVLLDEPEAHLHPPLLSAFIRALSELLRNRNGVAIIATHSPVILQEVPRSCVWKVRRSNDLVKAERPEIETFGENVGILTHEIFGLEVTHTGFHKLIKDQVNTYSSYEDVLTLFKRELGAEAKALVRALISIKQEGID